VNTYWTKGRKIFFGLISLIALGACSQPEPVSNSSQPAPVSNSQSNITHMQAVIDTLDDVTVGIAIHALYHEYCAPMPRDLARAWELLAASKSAKQVAPAYAAVDELRKEVGPRSWCTLIKPVVDNAAAKAARH